VRLRCAEEGKDEDQIFSRRGWQHSAQRSVIDL
jgi:hypothetical protein